MKFVEERRYFLEKFLRKLALNDFVLISEEFKIFSRLTGDIKKPLSNLPKMSPFAILDRFKNNFNISENQTSEAILTAKANISGFMEFTDKILPVLQSIKAQVKALAPNSQQQNDEYLEFLRKIEDYEYNGLMVTTKIPEHKLIVNSKGCHIIKKKIIVHNPNPFDKIYMWAKGEIYDIYAMREAVEARNSLIEQKYKYEQQKQQCEEDIVKIHSGKKTLKNIFKSSSSKQIDIQNLKNSIETTERVVTQYKTIINMINIYLSDIAIPKFKEEKLKSYYKILTAFSSSEITDSHMNVTFWTNVLNIVTQFGF